MLGMVKIRKHEVTGKMIYMEVWGENRVVYRVTSGRMKLYGEEVSTYGIEAEDLRTGEKEAIPDFSGSLEDAVDFAEILISCRAKPKQIYGKALNYLGISI